LSELSFPADEFERRLAGIRARMKAAGLDTLILTRGENIFYGCGTSPAGCRSCTR
jgi:Xaa-Pro aminopeptidase